MIRNYIKIAFRTFVKEKFYALINIIGLSLGIASSLLISVYILHETSYDDFHLDVENTYRVNMTDIWQESTISGASPIPLAESLASEFPSITSTLRINTPGTQLINLERGDGGIRAYNENNVLAVDSTFFEFFDIPLLEGDINSALDLKNSAVLTETLAKKYFGNKSALGKTLLLGNQRTPIKITGVSIDPPSNMHFDFDMLLSMHTNSMIKRREWSWVWTWIVTYVKVSGDPSIVQNQMPLIAPKYAAAGLKRVGIDLDEYQKEKGGINFYLQPVKDIHLYSGQIWNPIGTNSSIIYIYIFSTVALFILLLASINFINLTTARAAGRAKEIGIKKVLGSLKKQLIYQFLSEAILMSAVATIIALGLVELIKVWLIDSLGLLVDLSIFSDWRMVTAVLMLPFVLGVLAGSYPAFYLTAFKPAEVLKGKLQSGMKNTSIRNALVIFQFTIATTLMVCSLIAYRQLDYFKTSDLGFDRDHIMVIHDANRLGNQLQSFKNELQQHGEVIKSTLATTMPGNVIDDSFRDPNNPDKNVLLDFFKIDEEYMNTLSMGLVLGRNFSKERSSDKSGVIINKRTMHIFGWDRENVLGKKINYDDDSYEVIGVVSDFHNQSLRNNISPIAFFHINSNMWSNSMLIALKFKRENIKSLLSKTENNWKAITKNDPFTYSFLDENLAREYQAEEQIGQLFTVFTVLALIIACIGLFGLASYIATQRSKEIGVRKVLGASTKRLVIMLNKDFTKLVIVSIIIATPVSLWLMSKWLEQFANKITIGWNVFIIIGVSTLLISWFTVAFQSIKTALLNPAEILKDE